MKSVPSPLRAVQAFGAVARAGSVVGAAGGAVVPALAAISAAGHGILARLEPGLRGQPATRRLSAVVGG
jgi:hypothetical protein